MKVLAAWELSHFHTGWKPLLGVVERVSRVTKNMMKIM